MVFPIVAVGIIASISFLVISILGGAGLTFSLFKGLSAIPPFVWILIIIAIIMLLFRGGRK